MPFFFAIIIFFFVLFFSDFFLGILEKVDVCKKIKEIKVDEDLGNYFDCISLLHRKQWYLEEMNMRDKFDIYTLDNETLLRL